MVRDRGIQLNRCERQPRANCATWRELVSRGGSCSVSTCRCGDLNTLLRMEPGRQKLFNSLSKDFTKTKQKTCTNKLAVDTRG